MDLEYECRLMSLILKPIPAPKRVIVFSKLKNEQDIVALHPDKGPGAVFMNNTDYIQKMNVVLDGDTKFEECNTVGSPNDLERQITGDIQVLLGGDLPRD